MPNLSEFTSNAGFKRLWEKTVIGEDVIVTTAHSLNDAHRQSLEALLKSGATSDAEKARRWGELAILSTKMLTELDDLRVNIAKLDRERSEIYKLHSQRDRV